MNVTIVKLGGSLVTKKDEPLTLNRRAVNGISKALGHIRFSSKKLILVHGGGSFGHYYAKEYHLSTEYTKANPNAVAKTNSAMLQLHSFVLDSLVGRGVACKTIEATELIAGEKMLLSNIGKQKINQYLESNLTPITFGNVSVEGRGARIISGDALCVALARALTVKKVIFAMDVDGIYPDAAMKGDLIPILPAERQIDSGLRKFDVTGGINAKLEIAFELSRHGVDVYFLNGLHPDRIINCFKGHGGVKGTMIPRAVR
ncbi:MAG: isopentenyl phosphate kinase [Nitrososphaerales archaeon]